MEELVQIEAISQISPFRLKVWFSDGQAGEHDFSEMARAPGEALRAFRRAGFFDRVMYAPRFLAWPNGYDWCADALYSDMKAAGSLAPSGPPERKRTVGCLVPLPPEVADIYRAVERLEAQYPGRKFTPDGHLVGSIGEVVAAEALGLELYGASFPGHDARDPEGRDVQIKLTGANSVSLYATCDRLIVMRIFDSEFAEIVYDGNGEPAWEAAGRMQKNGQRPIGLSKLRAIGTALVLGRESK